MKEVDGRKYIDKQEVAKRLLNASIRAALSGECPVATSVLVGSADVLIREYAKATDQLTLTGIERFARPEYAKGVADAMASHYNFFKHANFDAALHLDVTNLSVLNTLKLFLAVVEFQHIFRDTSGHMSLFIAIMSILHPKTFDRDAMEAANPDYVRALDDFRDLSRDELFALAQRMFDDGDLARERAEDQIPLINSDTSGFYDEAPHRDIFKRAFPRD